MSLQKKVAHNTLIQGASKIISTLVGLFALAIMTRYLSRDGYGAYTIVITFVSFFAIIADLGLTLTTVQLISDPQANEKKNLNNLFTLRIVSALIFLGLAPIIAIWLPYSHDIKIGIIIGAASFVFIAINQILVGLFQKNLCLEKVAIAEIASRLALLAGTWLAVSMDWGLMGMLWSAFVANALSFLIHFAFSKKFASIKFEFDWQVWKHIATTTWPLAIIIAFNLLYLKTDTLILSFVKTPEEVGLYGSAYKVIDVLTALPFMFAGVVLPIMAAAWFKKEKDYFHLILQKSWDFMIISACPILVGAQFLATQAMTLVAGKEFASAGPILRILILAVGMIFINSIVSHGIIAAGQQKKLIGAYIFTSITAIAGYLIFIPKFSYWGAAAVTVYSETIIALLSLYYVNKITGFRPRVKSLFQSLAASAIMALALIFVPKNFSSNLIGLLSTIAGGGIIYVLALYATGGFSQEDFKIIFSSKKKINLE